MRARDVTGVGGVLVFSPSYVAVSQWFDKKKGKAMAWSTIGTVTSYHCCYSARDSGAQYCDERVCTCVCVCLSAIISSELNVRSSPNFCAYYLWPWFGPPLAA